jgi:hypothetical protein
MRTESEPAPHLAGGITDEDVRNLLRRAQRTVLILGVLLFLVFTFTMGWQSGLLEVAGAVISWTGIYEWRSLSRAVSATLDGRPAGNPASRTLVMFFLRLGMAGAILYASLKCLNGSVYALLAGIGLAVVALSIEGIRLLRH